MKKLAVAIPTYNRPAVIEEFIKDFLSRYQKYEIDVYIYDSSEGEETKDIVDRYLSENENLYYEWVDFSIHSNRKVYNIYRYFQKQNYKYLWICGDAGRYAQDTIEKIYDYLEYNYDIIILNQRDIESVGTREFTDANELFLNCAWHMTMYGVTIVNLKTLLKDTDWDYMIKRYMIPERINHSHVALYFEQLLKRKTFSAFHFVVPHDKFTLSPLKKGTGWHNEVFPVWITYWQSMIYALPQYYKKKEIVIKKHGVYSTIFGVQYMCRLRYENIYNGKEFLKYINEWKKVSDTDIMILFLIAIMPLKWVKRYAEKICIDLFKRKIIEFVKNYQKIYIYGCGKIANQYAGYLESENIEYEGFFVTKPEGNPLKFHNHDVISYKQEYIKEKDICILMGVNSGNYAQILEKYPELRNERCLFFTEGMLVKKIKD